MVKLPGQLQRHAAGLSLKFGLDELPPPAVVCLGIASSTYFRRLAPFAMRRQRHWEIGVTEFIFLMHDDSITDDDGWDPYIRRLQEGGHFEGGSAIGDGVCARKSGAAADNRPSRRLHPGACR